jgi:small nuclear ribonucleoprotein (snRNP)-like protein
MPKEKPPRSLLIVVEVLVGQTVEVELRDDTVVSGVLGDVDRALNLQLSNVVARQPDRPEARLEAMFINGRYVRYVHIPVRGAGIQWSDRQHTAVRTECVLMRCAICWCIRMTWISWTRSTSACWRGCLSPIAAQCTNRFAPWRRG